jgi:hypothetical protein
MRPRTFIRLVTGERLAPYGHRAGLFGAAYDLLAEARLAAEEQAELRSDVNWFEKNLAVPARFAPSSRAGAADSGICWLRAGAREPLDRLLKLARRLARAGVVIDELRTRRPGYVIWRDADQVVALPFADTPA